MPEPELHVRNLTPPLLTVVCDSGRHPAHPGDTCEETDELQAAFRDYLERSLADAYARAIAETEAVVDQWLITGDSTGAPYGFLSAERVRVPYLLSDAEMADHGIIPEVTGPTPAERAFAILEPHLGDVPLYRPRGRILRWPA